MNLNRHALVARVEAAERFTLAQRHGLEDVAIESLLANDSDSDFRRRLAMRLVARSMGMGFSFARMVANRLTGDGRQTGIELETLQEAAQRAGVPYRHHVPLVPWSLLKRDLIVGSAAQAGYLVGTDVGEARDVLRPWSITARAGITVYEGLKENYTEPRTTTKASVTWLPSEGSTSTESTPALGQIAIVPKTAVGHLEFSRLLNLQSPAAEAYIRREFGRTAGTAVDIAILNGSGAAGQPLGILNTPGILTQSGTTLGQAGVTNMKQLIASANAPEETTAFVTTPEVRELLENRERSAGNGFVWENDQVASRPAYPTTDMPAATMICAAWSEVILGLWGPGFEFELNAFDPALFKAGGIQARIVISCDVALAHATSFCASTSIT